MLKKELNDDLNIALEASRGAGDIIMKYYKHDYEIKEKGYHNPVTTADNEADDFLKKTLLDARPDYGWLSEETVDSKERLTKKKVWIVDPIDGTKEFIEGVPQFVVSIGLVDNGKPVVGILHNPATDETFYASHGCGSFLNEEGFCPGRLSIKLLPPPIESFKASLADDGFWLTVWSAFTTGFFAERPSCGLTFTIDVFSSVWLFFGFTCVSELF